MWPIHECVMWHMTSCEATLKAQVVNADKEMLLCGINGSTTGAYLVGTLHDADMKCVEYTYYVMQCFWVSLATTFAELECSKICSNRNAYYAG